MTEPTAGRPFTLLDAAILVLGLALGFAALSVMVRPGPDAAAAIDDRGGPVKAIAFGMLTCGLGLAAMGPLVYWRGRRIGALPAWLPGQVMWCATSAPAVLVLGVLLTSGLGRKAIASAPVGRGLGWLVMAAVLVAGAAVALMRVGGLRGKARDGAAPPMWRGPRHALQAIGAVVLLVVFYSVGSEALRQESLRLKLVGGAVLLVTVALVVGLLYVGRRGRGPFALDPFTRDHTSHVALDFWILVFVAVLAPFPVESGSVWEAVRACGVLTGLHSCLYIGVVLGANRRRIRDWTEWASVPVVVLPVVGAMLYW